MRLGTVAGTSAATAATALAGAAATGPGTESDWYRALRKPGFQPPATVFPVAWTTLYATIAAASARAIDRAEAGERRGCQRALAANLAVNGAWSWVFFRAHRLGAATATAAVLTVSSPDLARRSARADPRAGLALLPYTAWCAFATALSTALWRLNR